MHEVELQHVEVLGNSKVESRKLEVGKLQCSKAAFWMLARSNLDVEMLQVGCWETGMLGVAVQHFGLLHPCMAFVPQPAPRRAMLLPPYPLYHHMGTVL